MIPGRPYGSGIEGLRNEARRILRESSVPTPGSVSDRLRAKQKSHMAWAIQMDKRLDAIDAIEAKALPIIEGEMQQRERSVESLETDALAMQKLAEVINNGGPTVTSGQSAQGSALPGGTTTEQKT